MSETLSSYTVLGPPDRHPNLYPAVHLDSGTHVLVQFLARSHAMHPRDRFSLGQAVTTACSLNHPSILRLIDRGQTEHDLFGFPENTSYLVFENADIGHLQRIPGERSWARARAVVLSTLDVLAHAHTLGVIHGHLSPSKVMFRRVQNQVLTKIHGFGLFEFSDRDAEFSPPERHQNPSRILHPSEDLFALGRICEEMLENRKEFLSYDTVSTGLRNWLGRMIAINPDDRYASAREAAIEFAELDTSEPSRTLLICTPTLSPHVPQVVAAEMPVPPVLNPNLDAMSVRPLVGKADVLEGATKAYLRSLTSSRPEVCWIHGEAGMGASSIVDQVARDLAASFGADVLSVQHDTPSPLTSGLVAMVRDSLRPPKATLQTVHAHLQQLGISDHYTLAALTAFCSGLGEEPPIPVRFTRPNQHHGAVISYLCAKAAIRPLIVVVHDANQGLDTLRFIRGFCTGPCKQPVTFMLASNESDVAEGVAEMTQSIRAMDCSASFELASLNRAESESLLAMLGVPEHHWPVIVDVARGEPRLTRELAFELACGRALRRDLSAIYDARLTLIFDEFQDSCPALALAAVLGYRVSQTEWEIACDVSRLEFELGIVDRLVELRLATYVTRGWRFENRRLHTLMKDRVLKRAQWERSNLTIARVVEMRNPHGNPFMVAREAAHFIAGEDLERALPLAIFACDSLVALGWADLAEDLVESAFALKRRKGWPVDASSIHLWILKGRALLSRDAFAAAWWFERAMCTAKEASLETLAIDAASLLCMALNRSAQPEFVALTTETAVHVLNLPTQVPRAELRLAELLISARQWDLAQKLSARLDASALTAVERPVLLRIQTCAAIHEHSWEVAVTMANEAASMSDAIGDYESVAEALLLRARAEFGRGQEALGYALYHRANEMRRHLGVDPAPAEFKGHQDSPQ